MTMKDYTVYIRNYRDLDDPTSLFGHESNSVSIPVEARDARDAAARWSNGRGMQVVAVTERLSDEVLSAMLASEEAMQAHRR